VRQGTKPDGRATLDDPPTPAGAPQPIKSSGRIREHSQKGILSAVSSVPRQNRQHNSLLGEGMRFILEALVRRFWPAARATLLLTAAR
jgi:hypothetical protein